MKNIARSALLHQLQAEIANVSDLETWTGRLLGCPQTSKRKAISLGLPLSAAFGLGIEHGGMIYRKETYVVLGAQRAVQIHAGVRDSQNLWLIVETLRPGPAVQKAWPTWQRGPANLHCCRCKTFTRGSPCGSCGRPQIRFGCFVEAAARRTCAGKTRCARLLIVLKMDKSCNKSAFANKPIVLLSSDLAST